MQVNCISISSYDKCACDKTILFIDWTGYLENLREITRPMKIKQLLLLQFVKTKKGKKKTKALSILRDTNGEENGI